MKKALKLDVTSDKHDMFEGMEDTYRREGLTVGSDYMRIYGVDFNMEVTLSDLVIGRKIGQGACSTVHIAKHVETGETFAVKMFNIYDENQSRQLQIEICMLSAVKCDSLISLKGAFHSEGSIGIIIEYMDRGSLEFMLEENLEVSEPVLAAIVYQVLWGLGYLHFDNRMHRDIKPGNILINSQGEVKLSDFGISRSLDGTNHMSSTSVGSFRYMSPERLIGDKYDSSGDIWSLGIMMIQLWTKKYPFGCLSSPIDLLTEFENMEIYSFTKDLPKSMKEITQFMLARDPEKRGTCLELLESYWFKRNSINDIRDAQETVGEWIESLEIKKKELEKSINSSPRIGYSPESNIVEPYGFPTNNFNNTKLKENGHILECKNPRISNKENEKNGFESKNCYRSPIPDTKTKHLSTGSNYSNYSDDFEEYVENEIVVPPPPCHNYHRYK